MLYPGLNTKLMADNRSRVSQLTATVAAFYAAAAQGNYSISGVYIDSTQGFGAPCELSRPRTSPAGKADKDVSHVTGPLQSFSTTALLRFMARSPYTMRRISSFWCSEIRRGA